MIKMVHYKFECNGWSEGKKIAFGMKLSSEIGIVFGWDNSLVDASKPYIEVDRVYSGVSIRRMTNLTQEQQNEVVKVADEWHLIFQKISENDNLIKKFYRCVFCHRSGKDFGYNPEPVKQEGRCCNDCNLKIIIPARLKMSIKNDMGRATVLNKAQGENDINDDNIFFRGFGITDNDRLKNYQLVKIYWEIKMNSSETDENDFIGLENMNLLKAYWKSSFRASLDEAKLFTLEEDAVPLILHTDCQDANMPFNSFFIDAKVQIKNRTYFGFHVGCFYTEKTKYKSILTAYAKLIKHNGKMVMVIVPDFILLAQDNENEKLPFRKDDLYHNKVRNFIFAFCSFINEPEVSVHSVPVNPKNNERRIARGIMPLPEYKNIIIHGKLRIYIDEIQKNLSNGTRKSIGYRYWVRGFYRHFFNTKRYAKLYALDSESQAKVGLTFSDKHNGILRRWIKPSIRGQGILINQSWEVKE